MKTEFGGIQGEQRKATEGLGGADHPRAGRRLPGTKILFMICTLFIGTALSAPAADKAPAAQGKSPSELMELGDRMYREGLLPSGEPMEALVQRDIPVLGTMFTCDNCHLRSGLGSAEGTIVTLPTNGAKLYRPLRVGAEIETVPARTQLAEPFQGGDIRPAYTDQSLADALRNGVDPGGRELNWTMPRYLLDDGDMEVMVHYLKNLSAEFSPGVTDREIRYATVIAEEVPEEQRETMRITLQAVIKDRNSQSRHQEARASKGPFYKQEKYTAYRNATLDVWELKGARETWTAQLEAHYQKRPVFALLGGIVSGDWSPVHQFCEANKIPCIFPLTDLPVVAENDWYTLYFSKSYYQEGEAAARFIAREKLADDVPLVQLSVDTPESRLLADGFRKTARMLGKSLAEDRVVSSSELADQDVLGRLRQNYPNGFFVLWSGAEGLPALPYLAPAGQKGSSLIMSTSLLGEALNSLPEEARQQVLLTYPHRLPQQKSAFEKTVRNWLKIREIPVADITMQSKIFFLGWMLTGATKMMGDDFYRDYFLDSLDMMRDETYAITAYPRVGLGPGQRYAAKGCYIVKLGSGPEPTPVPVSGWVVH